MKLSANSRAKVEKWGKNLALRIPTQIVRSQKLTVGSVVDLESIRVVKKRRYKLDELMANFKPQHRHGEWDLGQRLGDEIW